MKIDSTCHERVSWDAPANPNITTVRSRNIGFEILREVNKIAVCKTRRTLSCNAP